MMRGRRTGNEDTITNSREMINARNGIVGVSRDTSKQKSRIIGWRGST